MSLQKLKPVYAANKWHFTLVVVEVQVLWHGVHKWQKAEHERDWYTDYRSECSSLHELCHSVMKKTGALKHCKPVNLVLALILTYGHEFWEMTKRLRSRVQVAEIAFSRRVHGVTLSKKVHNCEIYKALNVELLIVWVKRSQLGCFDHVFKIFQERNKFFLGIKLTNYN